jgi:Flp pilus assembly protein protease CpaA
MYDSQQLYLYVVLGCVVLIGAVLAIVIFGERRRQQTIHSAPSYLSAGDNSPRPDQSRLQVPD